MMKYKGKAKKERQVIYDEGSLLFYPAKVEFIQVKLKLAVPLLEILGITKVEAEIELKGNQMVKGAWAKLKQHWK